MSDTNPTDSVNVSCTLCTYSVNVTGVGFSRLDERSLEGFTCVRCGGSLSMVAEEHSHIADVSMSYEELFQVSVGTEPIGGVPPSGATIAALLTTYTIEKVVLQGRAITGILLSSGQYIEMGISRAGPVALRILEEPKNE